MADDLKVTREEAHEDDVDNKTKGAGFVHDGAVLVDDIGSHNWAEGLLDAGGAASTLGKFAGDPLAGLYAAGAGYLMEHVSFLKEPLDWLTGDQDAIDAASQTWGKIADELNKAGQQLSDHVQKDTAPWKGPAIDAYKPVATAHAELVSATSMAAKGASMMVSLCGTVLKVVRGIIRDLISKAVGDILACVTEWAAAELLSAGLATPGLVGDVIRRATSWASRIMTWVRKVTSVFDKAKGLIQKIKDLLQKVGGKLKETKVGKTATSAAHKVGDSKVNHAYQKIKKPFPEVEWPTTDPDLAKRGVNKVADGTVGKLKDQGAEKIDDALSDDDDQQEKTEQTDGSHR